jgi:hypothetical protein
MGTLFIPVVIQMAYPLVNEKDKKLNQFSPKKLTALQYEE